MERTYLHPSAEILIRRIQLSPPQSLLLTGVPGIGLTDIAKKIASIGTVRDEIVPDVSTTTPKISVTTIRRLQENSRSKSLGKQFILIHDVDTMTRSAQAAFLKLLEEPGESIYFILTSSSHERLSATILSRLQRHTIPGLTTEQSQALLDDYGIVDDTRRRQLLFIADGLPEELHRLIEDESYFKIQSELTVDARELLQASEYDRLLLAHKYKDDRIASQQLVKTAIKILKRSLSASPDASHLRRLDELVTILDRLQSNGNVRLQLGSFVV